MTDRSYANVVCPPKVKVNIQDIRQMVVSHQGIGHYVDLQSGKTIWSMDMRGPTYNAFTSEYDNIKKEEIRYLDLEEEGIHTYLHMLRHSEEPDSKRPLKDLESMDTEGMEEYIGSICMEKPRVKRHIITCYVNPTNGHMGSKTDPKMLKIQRVDWYIHGDIPDGIYGLHFAHVSVSFTQTEECVVHCAYSPEQYFKICQYLKLRDVKGNGILVRNFNSCKRFYIDHPSLVEASANGVSYWEGTSLDLRNKLFIKKAPLAVDFSKIIQIYSDCAHISNVVSLRSVAKDDEFCYMAFEETLGSLARYIRYPVLLWNSKKTMVLKPFIVVRNVVHALMQLEKNDKIHGHVAPQHVLIRRGPGNDNMIKLCGMSKSERVSNQGKRTQNYQLARTILNFLGGHTFDGTQRDDFVQDDLVKVGHVAAHLCRKLMDPLSSISLLEVYNHILFWDVDTQINFIGDVCIALSSIELSGIQYGDIQYGALEVFGNNGWKSKVDEKWVLEMERDSKHDRSVKADAYDKDSLLDLVKIFRNSIQHPKKINPANCSITWAKYISEKFPRLMPFLYDHMLKNKGSTLYKKYIKKEV